MSFTVIAAGDPGAASLAMANWRHVNFGSDLLPVNSSGSGVSATLSIGSATYSWIQVYLDNGATHGGRIQFNAGSSYIGGSTDGNTVTYQQVSSAGTALTLAVNDGGGRESVLKSPGSAPNGQVGTSTSHQFEFITSNTVRGFINAASDQWTLSGTSSLGSTYNVGIHYYANATTLGQGLNLNLHHQGGSTTQYTQIGMGYCPSSANYSPCSIGWVPVSVSGNTYGDFFVALRNSTSDIAPSEIFRITSSGVLSFGLPDRLIRMYHDGGDIVLEKAGEVMARW